MEEIDNEIKELSRYRIEYFLKNPEASKLKFLKEIKEKITTIVQEVPIAPGQKAQTAYLTGKILNINPEFDQNAVDALNKALKLDVNNHNARIELGKLMWKKGDIEQAFACFAKVAENSTEPRALCYYATVLRNQASSTSNKRDQLIKIKESIDLSKKVTEIDPNYGFGWYSLGNSYLCRFFITAQLDSKDLDRAIESFEHALEDKENPFINPDLHVNFAEALIYKQDYPYALTNLTRAIEIEPHFEAALERLDLLRTFLFRLNDCIIRKGQFPAKKVKELAASIDPNGYTSIYPDLSYSKINDLNVGTNQQAFICLKVVGVVSHSNQIPFAMIGVDADETFAAITVFNFSSHFKALVGDCFMVPVPLLIDLKDVKISPEIILNIKIIRVDNPIKLCKNNIILGPENKALTDVRFGLK